MMNRKLLDLRCRPKQFFKSLYPSMWELLESINRPTPCMIPPNPHIKSQGIEIRFADNDKLARKVVKRSNYRMTGKFSSRKNNRSMQWESRLEKAAFSILEACPLVISYREQPAEISYQDEWAVWRVHFPDILVELTSGSHCFLEIKPQDEANDPDLIVRTDLLSKQLQVLGFQYLLVFSDQIESEAYLANSQQLVYQSRGVNGPPPWESFRRAFQGRGPIELEVLVKNLHHPRAKIWVYRLILEGHLVFDQSQLLSSRTLINLAQGA